MTTKHGVILFLFTLAFLLRLLLVPNPGFEADVSFWKSWGLATADYGIVEGIKLTNNNYPTPFAYTLGFMVKLYSLFRDPHTFNEFWQNTNLTFLAISKLFPILADFGIAALILWIGNNAKRLGFPPLPPFLYVVLSALYLFNPVSLMDGALWGQVDSLGVLIFLIAFLFSLKRQPFWAGAVFLLAVMTKLQNIIYGPLLFLFIWHVTGPDGLARASAGALLALFGLNIEFFLSRNMDRVISSLTTNYDYFPWMSLNAFNLWWIVSGAHGMQVSDKIAVFGITNAKTVGLLLFSSFHLFSLPRLFLTSPPHGVNRIAAATLITTSKTFIESLITVNASFFLFMTQSHERYAFPLSIFLLLWAPFWIATDTQHVIKKRFKIFTVFYLLFTLIYFYNLHTALVFNYPNNGLPWLSNLIQPGLTIATSIALIVLFALFLLTIARSSMVTLFCLLFTMLLFCGGLLFLNKPLFTKKPLLITQFTPIISKQDYGSRETNMSVNSGFGTKSWNRLSVQYAFYKYGIGTHANSRHVFDINRKFTRFTTDYGIDTEAGQKATAVFEIYGDNTLLFRSEKMGRYDLPRHAEVNVAGVKFLSLVTTDAGDGNTDDHTDWLTPQLWP